MYRRCLGYQEECRSDCPGVERINRTVGGKALPLLYGMAEGIVTTLAILEQKELSVLPQNQPQELLDTWG